VIFRQKKSRPKQPTAENESAFSSTGIIRIRFNGQDHVKIPSQPGSSKLPTDSKSDSFYVFRLRSVVLSVKRYSSPISPNLFQVAKKQSITFALSNYVFAGSERRGDLSFGRRLFFQGYECGL
jgi:hypothetical protein